MNRLAAALLVAFGLLAASAAHAQDAWPSSFIGEPSDEMFEAIVLLQAGCKAEAEKLLGVEIKSQRENCQPRGMAKEETRRLITVGAASAAVYWCNGEGSSDDLLDTIAPVVRTDRNGEARSDEDGVYAAGLVGFTTGFFLNLVLKDQPGCTIEQSRRATEELDALIAREDRPRRQ